MDIPSEEVTEYQAILDEIEGIKNTLDEWERREKRLEAKVDTMPWKWQQALVVIETEMHESRLAVLRGIQSLVPRIEDRVSTLEQHREDLYTVLGDLVRAQDDYNESLTARSAHLLDDALSAARDQLQEKGRILAAEEGEHEFKSESKDWWLELIQVQHERYLATKR